MLTERPPLVGEVSANLCGERVSRGQRNGFPRPLNLGFLDRSRYFSIHVAPSYPHEAEWNAFQTHYFSENLVAPGIEPGTFGSVARKSEH
jgi:hypothetical protein